MADCKHCDNSGLQDIGEGMSKVCPACHGTGDLGSVVLTVEEAKKAKRDVEFLLDSFVIRPGWRYDDVRAARDRLIALLNQEATDS